MRFFVGLFAILTVLALRPVPSPAQDWTLHVQPDVPRQGEVLFVTLDAPVEEPPTLTWLKHEYPMHRRGNTWTAALPIPADTAPGGHTVTVTGSRNGETQTLKRVMEVAAVAFPIQRLRMSPARSSLYTYPGVEKEDAAIRAAVNQVTEEAAWSGNWIAPAKGRYSTPYGVRRLRNGKEVGRHSGLDIAAPTGAPVVAPAAGRVSLTAGFKKHGNTVVVDHGQGISSVFIHLSKIEVKEGQTVSRGARLGLVGSTGASTGPHLHWSVKVHGTNVDPRYFLRLKERGVQR